MYLLCLYAHQYNLGPGQNKSHAYMKEEEEEQKNTKFNVFIYFYNFIIRVLVV